MNGDKKMIFYERQNQIIEHLKAKKLCTVKELSQLVFASESSVRRDVKLLEQKGYLKQVYGGVILCEQTNSVVPLPLRDASNISVKEELAKRAAEEIFDGATVMADGSSTVRRIIKYINRSYSIRIITNNLSIVNELSESPSDNIKLFCTGGLFVPQSNIFIGSSAESYVKNVYADLLFFSSQALSLDGEISDVSEEETSLRRAMLTRAKRKIFLCDSSKLSQKRTFTLCTKDDVDRIICDKPLPWEK